MVPLPQLGRRREMATVVCNQFEVVQAIEENILALVDTVGLRDAEDIEDDKMSFLEAVYALSIAPEVARGPTKRIYEAIFAILEENYSVRLNLASYLLLVKLDKCYPRVVVEQTSDRTSDASTKDATLENKIWSPLSADFDKNEKSSKMGVATRGTIPNACDYGAFVALLESIANETDAKQGMETGFTVCKESQDGLLNSASQKILGLVLKFTYFVHEIEQDFKCRYEIFQVTENMDVMTSSFLIQIFKGQRRKELVTYLLRLIAGSWICRKHDERNYNNEKCNDLHHIEIQAEAMDLTNLTNFCSSVQSLLLMIMDFDIECTKKVEASPKSSRQDYQRISIWDLISDIIGYEKFLLAPLLQFLERPIYKLNVIFSYFIRNAPQPIVEEMKEKRGKVNVQDFLSCFTELKDARNIYRSIETDILQLLLAHAFKAFFMQQIYCEHNASDSNTQGVCRLLTRAFENLQTISSDFEIHPAGKQALISAEILSAHLVLAKQ